MLCPMCNTPNRDDAKFCKKCGHPLRAEQSQPATVATANQSVADTPQNGVLEEDIADAQTQIISPQQMMEMQARRWQHEDERDQEAAPPDTPTEEPVEGNHNEASDAQSTAQDVDIASLPTMIIAPPADETTGVNEEQEIPPPADEEDIPASDTNETNESLPVSQEDAQEEDAAPESSAGAEAAGPDSTEDKDEHVTTDEQVEAQETPQESSDFPTLPVGTQVINRYEITQVDSAEAGEHLYQVVDHQGYQRCWNCGSEENREGDEFCVDCGAGLLNASYIMHEYPAAQSAGGEASVLHETIVNTFVDQGRTFVVTQPQAAEHPFPNGVHLTVASDSDAGDIRRSDPNEDSTLVLFLQRIHESTALPTGLFVVADGMGGHDNGQRASRVAISTMAEYVTRNLLLTPLNSENTGESVNPPDEDSLVSLLHDAVEAANAAIHKENQRDKSDMGSTITGFMISGDYAYIFNVGDSRTYMLRGGQIYQLTTDHSLVAQLVAGGLIQPDDVYTHPQRSQIFRSLGDKLNVQIDIFKQQLHPGDVLLSCCDGLWEMVRNPQIESILNGAPNLQTACRQLIDAANENGGEDNISAVLVAAH